MMAQCSIHRQTIAVFLGLAVMFAFTPPVQAETLSLDEAYRAALATHEAIDIAGKEVEKSKLLPKKALSIMLPHAKIDSEYDLLDDEMDKTTQSHLSVPPLYDGNITVGPTLVALREQFGASFTLHQSIYRGEFFPLRKAAAHKIEQSYESLFETRQGILFDVATVYYEAVTAKALISTSEELLAVAKKDLESAQIKVKAGKLTEDAIYRAQLNVTRAERQRIVANQWLQLAKEALGRLTGMESAVDEIEKPAELVARQDDFDTLLDIAYKNRFDYKISKLNIELARDDLNLSKSKRHPTVGAEWKYFWYDKQPPSIDKEFWAAAIKVSLPIFEGGARILEVREKGTTVQQAQSACINIKKNIRLEVEQSLLEIKAQDATLANARQLVETANKNYEMITVRYGFGAATSLESEQAFAALNNAKTQLVSETYNYQIALLKLEKALGVFNRDLIEVKPSMELHGALDQRTVSPTANTPTQSALALRKSFDPKLGSPPFFPSSNQKPLLSAR